ncbi:Zn-ribbon domain-containing OB-fold protein [Phenylobacterium sp.]|uniref:Zn-ribbon domain-containing OB-fold protein n=1 Tax=Phenylobacterium sp. TaxID=1871053 RepID=UPI002F42DA98
MAPIAQGLFEVVDGGPRLIGGVRKSDGKVVFPMPEGPEAQFYEPTHLAPEGTLWSYTVQRFRPKTPPYQGADDEESFRPFALGYVELPGQVIVESRLATEDFGSLKVGMPMRLTLMPFHRAGGDVLTFAFQPSQGAPE